MLGLVLTGHGGFAQGMENALAMIAGPQEQFLTVPFLEENPLADFEKELQGAIDQLKETCDGVVICVDLVGGTPFNVAMTAANEDPQVEVIGGSNLLMLVEGSLTRYTAADPERFCQELAEIGKTGIFHGKIKGHEEINEEEGI